jgi:hypothetical protein
MRPGSASLSSSSRRLANRQSLIFHPSSLIRHLQFPFSTLRVIESLSRLCLAWRVAALRVVFPGDFLESFFDFQKSSGIFTYRGERREFQAPSQRPRVVPDAEGGHTSHDPSHRAAALCVGLYTPREVAAFGSVRWGARQPTERPGSPPPVASATGRTSGRAGRLRDDSAVSASPSAAVVAWARFRHSCTGGFFGRRIRKCFHSFTGGSFDRRIRKCLPRRVGL